MDAAICLDMNGLEAIRQESAGLVGRFRQLPTSWLRCWPLYRFYWETYGQALEYFSRNSLARLAMCCDPEQAKCRECLRNIYESEQELLRLLGRLRKFPFIGPGFALLMEELEDRAETLALSVNEEAYLAVRRLIGQVEQEKVEGADWRKQLAAL